MSASELDGPPEPADTKEPTAPPTASPERQPATAPAPAKKLSWEAIAAVTAVAALVATVVFGVLQLFSSGSDDSPETSGLPADERLELVEVEYATAAAPVIVLEDVTPGDDPSVPLQPGASPGPDDPTENRLRLVLTLRNPTDNPAVLTGIKVVVHEIYRAPACGRAEGGGVNPSLNYDFRFPDGVDLPWEQTHPQNFSVAPRSVDALSITMGPELSGHPGKVWRYSVYGVSTGGRQALWAVGLATEYPPLSDEAYHYHAWAPPRNPDDAESVRDCAAGVAERLRSLLTEGDPPATVIHPGVERLAATYQEIADA